MPSTISAGTTAGTAIAVAGDTTGNLAFQTNGTTTAMTIDTSQNVGIGTTSPSSYAPAGSRLAVVNTTSGAVCNMSIVNNSTDLYEGGGLLLGNSGLTTNYDATYLYHHKFDNTGNDYSAFNISQRRVDGTYIANIWNVDYKNNALAWYRPNTGAQTMGIDASGNLQFNSGYGSVATAYGCRAWVNFNGTGTVAIRASGNVSSITDNAVGLFTVNYSTAMPDVNYSVSMNMQPVGDPGYGICHIGPTGLSPANYSTTATTIRTAWNNAAQDPPIVVFAAFR